MALLGICTNPIIFDILLLLLWLYFILFALLDSLELLLFFVGKEDDHVLNNNVHHLSLCIQGSQLYHKKSGQCPSLHQQNQNTISRDPSFLWPQLCEQNNIMI